MQGCAIKISGVGPHSDIPLRGTITTRQHPKSCKTSTAYVGNIVAVTSTGGAAPAIPV
jgi:hypothetical protein